MTGQRRPLLDRVIVTPFFPPGCQWRMSVPAAGPDRRRNGGPETSVRPVRDPSVCGETRGPLLSSELVRRDGRYPEQLRPFGRRSWGHVLTAQC